jgi:hypothetical protein
MEISKNNNVSTAKVTNEIEGAINLLEIEFKYRREIAGHKVFRKRK